MKKIYLSALLFGFAAAANAQNQSNAMFRMGDLETAPAVIESSQSTSQGFTTKDVGAEIWTDNFDDGTNWTFDNTVNTGYTGTNYGWNIGATVDSWWTQSANGANFVNGILSTSGGSFAEVNNGDYFANTVDSTNNVTYTMTSVALDIPNLPLNATNTENVILTFEQFGALFNDGQTVEISTDGSLWTEIFTNNDRVTFVGNNPDAVYDNPETIEINLSPYTVGNAASVQIRFSWTSRFNTQTSKAAWTTFGWFIDDVKLTSQPTNDVKLLNSYIVGVNNEGSEYGRTPESQLDADWIVGGTVLNFGSVDQPTTNLTADFGTFTSNSTNSIDADSTRQVENTETLTLPIGTYTGDYTVTAGTELAGEPSFADNTGSRTFEVTSDAYSIDGIGVYPAADLVTSSITTASFTGAQDNLICASMYHIKSAYTVNTIEVMLSSNTAEGGQLIAYITDTSNFFAATPGIGTPVGFSSGYQVTAQDVTNGFVQIPLNSPVTLNPGAYYAAIEMSSGGGTAHVGVLDDQTVAQPGAASMIIIPANATDPATLFSNGTATAIRLNNSEVVGITENTLTGVSIYPNPSNGVFTITNDKQTANSVKIYNMVGKEVYSNVTSTNMTVNISENGAGVYIVKVSNETGSAVKRVVIK